MTTTQKEARIVGVAADAPAVLRSRTEEGRDSGPHSLYLPPRLNQGQQIPGHLRWDRCHVEAVTLHCGPRIGLAEAYNATRGLGTDAIELRPDGPQGYIGFLLNTSIEPESAADLTIQVGIACDRHGATTVRWSGTAYRPDLEAGEVPAAIRFTKEADGWRPDRPLILRNVGHSLAVIHVATAEGSEAVVETPDGMEDFLEAVLRDFVAASGTLMERFPERAPLVKAWLAWVEAEHQDLAAVLAEGDLLLKRLIAAFAADEAFARAWRLICVRAWAANWNLATMSEHFLQYLRSLAAKRVIVRNLFGVVRVGRAPERLHLRLEHCDLARNCYAPILIGPCLVSAPEDVEIPLHRLLEFEEAAR